MKEIHSNKLRIFVPSIDLRTASYSSVDCLRNCVARGGAEGDDRRR
jgi:hypothetical protein